MEHSDYPRSCREAGRISAEKQRLYRLLTQANLILLALGAAIGFLGSIMDSNTVHLSRWGAASIFLAVVVWLVLGFVHPDNEWFDARAVAESLKTMTWRYMMKASPYGQELTESEAKERFLEEMRQILQEKSKISAQMQCPEDQTEITTFMSTARSSSFEDRKGLYLEARVRDQKNWYNNKSMLNRSGSRRLFWIAFSLQVGAMGAAGFCIVCGGLDLSGLMVTLAALVMTWLQVQQNAYLAHSYGSAAQEFAIIEEKAVMVDSEVNLGVFVDQAELAASREHTMWVSRNVF
ncbi:MAG: DUF4231 domain-containing protein [Synergistales bacterium]